MGGRLPSASKDALECKIIADKIGWADNIGWVIVFMNSSYIAIIILHKTTI